MQIFDIIDNSKIKEIKSFILPMMMNKNRLCTINNFQNFHWSTKSKLKNQYKELISNWFFDDDKLPEDCLFIWEPIYKDNRKRDSVNLASICKVLEDIFTEIGALKDDNKTSHLLLPGSSDKNLVEHKLKLTLMEKLNEKE